MQSVLKSLKYLLLLNLLIQSYFVVGQTTEFVYGKLIDAVDKAPIPFAHITVKHKTKGTISNMDGGFRIPDEYYTSGDTLVISSIGYSSMSIPLVSLSPDIRNIIILRRKEEVLNEVVLGASEKKKRRRAQEIDYSSSKKMKRRGLRHIVELAIEKIPKNYPFKPFSYIGYYRDYQLKEGDYVNFNEAILQVFDAGFKVHDSIGTRTRIYQYDMNHVFPIDSLAAIPYDYSEGTKEFPWSETFIGWKIVPHAVIGSSEVGRNEFTLLRTHDAIRNYNINTYDFVNRLDLNFVMKHQFRRLPDTFIDSIPLYAISIKKYMGSISVDGKIFISKGDYKIYKMQYAVFDKDESIVDEKKLDTNAKPSIAREKKLGKLLYEIIVEYRPRNGIMYPNYISVNNLFKSWQSPGFFPIGEQVINVKKIKITFSKKPSEKNAMNKKNYKLWYNLIKLEIDSIELDKNAVLLHLKKEIVFDSRQNKLSDLYINQRLRVEYKNMRDVDGYSLPKYRSSKSFKNDSKVYYRGRSLVDINGYSLEEYMYVPYNQYREFFVQELKIDTKGPIDALYMHNKKPIYENQPIAPYTNLDNYWMNTPLKN